MGFLSNLFGKKKVKLTSEQIEKIDDKVEETQIEHIKDREIFSNLRKPAKIVKNPVKKIVVKPIKKTVKKSGAKKVEKLSRKKDKKRSKKRGRK